MLAWYWVLLIAFLSASFGFAVASWLAALREAGSPWQDEEG